MSFAAPQSARVLTEHLLLSRVGEIIHTQRKQFRVVFLLLSMRVLPANVVLSGSALVASIKTALPAQFSVQDFGPLNGRIGPW